MSALLLALLASSITPRADLPETTADPCATFDQPQPPATGQAVSIDDLVELADIGRSDPNETASAFGVSPDGKRIAFQVRRGNAQTNSYCLKLMIMPLDTSAQPEVLDRDNRFLRDDFALRDFASVSAGWAKVIEPRWSPDGTVIAYLRKTGGAGQLWLVDAEGSAAPRQLTRIPDTIDAFAWTDSGDALIVATRPGIREAAQDIAARAHRGFLYDKSISPQFSARPIPMGATVTEYVWVDRATGAQREATRQEAALLLPKVASDLPEAVRLFAKGPDGIAAWTEPRFRDRFISPSRLALRYEGKRKNCSSRRCEGLIRLWWSESQQAFIGVQKTGWGMSAMGLLRWDPEEPEPQQLVVSDDMLIGCSLARDELICAREGARSPRRLVAFDLASGKERLIHDPNPQFAERRLGSIERLRFRNAYGVESYADLVLPPGHMPGQRHPLVVVQYASYGLLRGGSGDEVPIQPLAARGFAVLSVNKPDLVPEVAKAANAAELLKANRIDWLDRRNVQSSLEIAVDLALATGAIDPERMGITGWSDGVSSAQFALINSDLFKVAALGSCCEDMYSYVLAAGPAYSEFTRSIGYKFFEEGDETFWRPMSLILNVDKVSAPILIQNADSEYEGGLDVVEVYKQRAKAIELYVFEDETHYKWQPAHRRAIYDRTIRWLEFWLMRRASCNADMAAERERWLAMPGAPGRAELACTPPP